MLPLLFLWMEGKKRSNFGCYIVWIVSYDSNDRLDIYPWIITLCTTFLHRKEVAYEIRKLAQNKKQIIVITHDPEFIFHCCTYIVEIKDGKIQDQYPLDKHEKKLIDYFSTDR